MSPIQKISHDQFLGLDFSYSKTTLTLTLLWQYAHENSDRPGLTFCHITMYLRQIDLINFYQGTNGVMVVSTNDFWSTDCGLNSWPRHIFSLFFPNMRLKVSLGLSKERTATVKLELSDSSNFFKYLTGMMAVTDYRLCCGYGNSGTDTRGFDCLIIPGARSQNGQDLNAGTLNFHPLLHLS